MLTRKLTDGSAFAWPLAALVVGAVAACSSEVRDGSTPHVALGATSGAEAARANAPALVAQADDDDDDGDDEGEVEIPLSEVPANVMRAATDAVPGLVVEEADRVGSGASAVYELEGAANGHRYEVEVRADGTVVEIEVDDEDDDD